MNGISLYCGDCLDVRNFDDDTIDLLLTSPPYEAARTYGIGFARRGQDWVDWMRHLIEAFAPKVKGLIAIVCDGQTRNYRYSMTPFLLMADLHRAGFNLRKPAIYKRGGIAGSGGPDWLRNMWEPIICITRSGRLPYSDNTACGHPPKFGPGGMPTYRRKDGTRLNGSKATDRRPNGELKPRIYVPPKLANPGNIVDCGAGGGNHLGHKLAHENEAPFPLKLAEFFVKSFCPPGGVVLDPFCGSGTTIHAAIINGRRGIGIDVRQSQIDLTRKRLESVAGNPETERSDAQECVYINGEVYPED